LSCRLMLVLLSCPAGLCWSYCLVLQADVGLCARQVETLQSDLASRLLILREAVQAKTAVPTALVFVRTSDLLLCIPTKGVVLCVFGS